jgi:hypothetical protein
MERKKIIQQVIMRQDIFPDILEDISLDCDRQNDIK